MDTNEKWIDKQIGWDLFTFHWLTIDFGGEKSTTSQLDILHFYLGKVQFSLFGINYLKDDSLYIFLLGFEFKIFDKKQEGYK